MRIIIETEGKQEVLLQPSELAAQSGEEITAEDAGPPTNELLDALGGREQEEEKPLESPGGDAGPAPDWLIDLSESEHSTH